MSPQVANFFWHGQPMSLYEQACIMSFVEAGFDCRLWLYSMVGAPEGVSIRDAREILPISDTERYTQGGRKGSLASFANFFRYALLSNHEGWWFDADVLCLKEQHAFAALPPTVLGLQDRQTINNAVLRMDAEFARVLLAEANDLATRQSNEFFWGQVGPSLLTRLAERQGHLASAFPPQAFFPVGYASALSLLDPAETELIKVACHESYTLHLWNEILSIHAIPKNVLPPENSWLHRRFVELMPRLRDMPCLPIPTFRRLAEVDAISRRGLRYHGVGLLRAIGARLSRHSNSR